MMKRPKDFDGDFFDEVIKNVFGEAYKISKVKEMLGGAQKLTYLIRCSNAFSCVLYVWDEERNFFPNKNNTGFVSSDATLFEINQNFLKVNGINTPEIYYIDRSLADYDHPFALVQYINGGDISEYYQTGSEKKGLFLTI